MKPSVLCCPYCKAALHPARCPWCFTWAFSESAVCPGCEATAPRDADYALSCPACRVPLNGRESDGARLGGWFDSDELAAIAACVRAGGLEKARKSELPSPMGERPARFIPPLESVSGPLVPSATPSPDSTPLIAVLAAAAELLQSFRGDR